MNLFDRPAPHTLDGGGETRSVIVPVAPPPPPKATVGLRRISHSELATFRSCARLHYYSYRLRREPRVTATPLLVGRRVETIIKQIWRGESHDLSELPPEERALCKAYPIWWRHHSLRVKRVDIPFQVPMGDSIMYIGELDGDGEDSGEEVLVELKTTSEDIGIGASYWRRVAQVDPQVTTYLMAVRAQGRRVRRVVYDVIRKATLERAMATPPDKRKYTKATKSEPARLYANQREHDETEDEFELRVLEDIEKQPEKYFQRRDIVRYEDEHQAHMRDVAGTVRLMQVVEEMPEAPRNVDACFRWGRSCAFLPVCLGEDRIDNEALYQDRVRRTKEKT